MNRPIQAGFAITDISPKKGVPLGGYPHHPRPNKGVHDPLYAACIYLDDGSTKLAIVNMDLISYSKKYVKSVREQVSRKTSIPAENILISCSHTHSAPRASANMTMDAMEGLHEADSEFVDGLQKKLIALISEASSSPFPARIGIEKGYCGREQGVGGNRRDPRGLADPDVWTLGIQDLQGNWKAILVKYALHPTFLHSEVPLVVKSQEIEIDLRSLPERGEAEAEAEKLKKEWQATKHPVPPKGMSGTQSFFSWERRTP